MKIALEFRSKNGLVLKILFLYFSPCLKMVQNLIGNDSSNEDFCLKFDKKVNFI